MNISDVIPHWNKTAFPSGCFQAEMGKYTAYAKDRVKAHFKVLQISTDLLIVWIKGHALNVHTLICIFEYISFSLKSRHYPNWGKEIHISDIYYSIRFLMKAWFADKKF